MNTILGTNSSNPLAGPAWDNSDEYSSLEAPELASDLARVEELAAKLSALSAQLSPLVPKAEALTQAETSAAVSWAQEATKIGDDADVLLANASTYVSCTLSVDGKNAAAKALQSRIDALAARLEQARNGVSKFLRLTADSTVELYLDSPHTAMHRFRLLRDRLLRPQTLSLAEEDLIIGLAVNGPLAWGNLYNSLAGSISCELELPAEKRHVGLAEAASLTQHADEAVRKAAFRAVQKSWESHEEAAAGILNALAGWRLDLNKRRSFTQPVHFLDGPMHSSRISRATLDAMMMATTEAIPLGRQVLKLQAQVLGKRQLGPWDLFAPCPSIGEDGWKNPSFAEAITIIADAYSEIHPEMGAFVRMMAERRWIEGRVGATKRPGAFCTGFAKSRSPRVYMTYTGGMRELKTLAHELGHALHSWVMRDMSLNETRYPMTLAETASIFGETVVNSALIAHAKSPSQRLSFTWAQAREVESLLLNIPARLQFEHAFYEKRREGTLTPHQLRELMNASWKTWYGDELSEMDPMFWASKLHFSISGTSFYNFPYTFGYLFALGVYAQRAKLGTKFYAAYVALLRDTGRMTAEDVAAKHLNADLTKPDFWRQSIKVARQSVDDFAAAVQAVNLP